MREGREKLNRIEELKTKLSSKGYEVKRKERDNFTHLSKKTVADSWEKKRAEGGEFVEKILEQTSVFKKFFIFSIIFFVLAAGFATYTFFGRGNTISNENIEISILGNAFTAGGEELPLQIEIINRNSSPLELADLLIEYPRSSSEDLSRDTERMRVSLGTIPAGGVRTENLKIVLFGEQGSFRPIRVSLEYRVEGSNAIFVKSREYEVNISSTPVDLSVEGPTETSPNQSVVFNVKATLNATRPVSKMMVKIDYPIGFQFESATPEPTIGNNLWDLGDLSPGAERDISIAGKMIEVSDGEEKTFRLFAGSEKEGSKTEIGTIFNSFVHTLFIKKPFIEANLFVNREYEREYAVNTKTVAEGEIRWINNLDTQVNDLEIRAKIFGNALDRAKLEIDEGFYNSSEDIIIWDKNSKSEFKEVGPGRSGRVTFKFSPKPLLSGTGGLLADPTIQIEVSISGKQPTTGYSVGELKNSETKIIKVISEVGLATKALYYSGPFKNTGPIPPKVEQRTTYTIVWSVSNTANNISNTEVRSTLPPWVSFVGPVSPPAEDLSYNPSTKEIVWNIGNLKRGLGITGASREVSFQLELLPSLSQVGTAPTLINDAVLTGRDDFAKASVRVNKASLNTLLGNDPAFPPLGDRVVE